MVYEDRIARLYVERELVHAQRAQTTGFACSLGSYRNVWTSAAQAGSQAQEHALDAGIRQLLALEPEQAAAERYGVLAALRFWRAELDKRNVSPELLRVARGRVDYLRAGLHKHS